MLESRGTWNSPAADSPPYSADPLDGVQHLPPFLNQGEAAEEVKGVEHGTIFRDIRRYFCDYCGICRSKKALIRSHMLAHHKVEVAKLQDTAPNAEKKADKHVLHTCQECGANFRKPAYLRQHMQGHSLQDLTIWKCCVKHWIPCNELQNAKRQHPDLEWTSIRWGTSCEAPSGQPPSRSYIISQEAFCLPHG